MSKPDETEAWGQGGVVLKQGENISQLLFFLFIFLSIYLFIFVNITVDKEVSNCIWLTDDLLNIIFFINVSAMMVR